MKLDKQEHSATSTDEQRGPARKRSKSNHSNCEHKVRVRNATYELLKAISTEQKTAMSAIIDELVQERALRLRSERGTPEAADAGARTGIGGGYGMPAHQGGPVSDGAGLLPGGLPPATADPATLRQYISQLQQEIGKLEAKVRQVSADTGVQHGLDDLGGHGVSRLHSRQDTGPEAHGTGGFNAGFPSSSAHDAGQLHAVYRGDSSQSLTAAGSAGATGGSGQQHMQRRGHDRPSPKSIHHAQGHHQQQQTNGLGGVHDWPQLLLKQPRGQNASHLSREVLASAGLQAGGGGGGGVQGQRTGGGGGNSAGASALASAIGLDQAGLMAASFGSLGTLGQHLDLAGAQLGSLASVQGAAGGLGGLGSLHGLTSSLGGGGPGTIRPHDLAMLQQRAAAAIAHQSLDHLHHHDHHGADH